VSCISIAKKTDRQLFPAAPLIGSRSWAADVAPPRLGNTKHGGLQRTIAMQSWTTIFLKRPPAGLQPRTRITASGNVRLGADSAAERPLSATSLHVRRWPTAACGRWCRKAALRRNAQFINRLLCANIGNRGSRPIAAGQASQIIASQQTF
jgi:hypothetical protein